MFLKQSIAVFHKLWVVENVKICILYAQRASVNVEESE